MIVGIMADTHNHVARTRSAIDLLQGEGVDVLVHCGDLATPEIVAECAILPFYFVFGNHDADMVGLLRAAAKQHGATCLEWGGEFSLAGKRLAVTHGHLASDLRPLLATEPDYLFTGHSHEPRDWREGNTRRINPGALYRASEFTVATLEVATDSVQFLTVPS
jgi:hypothetical protein